MRARASTAAAIASGSMTFTGYPPTDFPLSDPTERTDDGVLIAGITPAWISFLEILASDPAAFMRLEPREFEELIAAAYQKDGWKVTLTPEAATRAAM
jgi:hypothetical protein